ncbi:leucine-rich repeat-containing protein 49 [Planococcus citri]|uniref:leucine-rich repeat-containing protein 49 n=1 Tax=Planococcus citri TaxID=170843 RepID=UPI0031F8722C
MKPRQKNYLDVNGCSVACTADRIPTPTHCSVLPLFPSAPKPPPSSKRLPNNSNIMNNTEDVIMTPCNTIILQTTVDGKIQVSRTQKERERNPDRLSLDRRGLTVFPILVGEAKLRLLSLQHNLLTKLERMALLCLPHLVFLDIYNNQLENMAALDCLHHLRVLLLGKNRIKTIEGLSNMNRLEVLDLHGNRISEIKDLRSQKELKVLNLAGNEIKSIGIRDLEGLSTLQEMNLRRNQIKKLAGFDETPQLFKLFLSNNDVSSIDELGGLRKLRQLKELSLDGNPVISSEDCILYIISYIPSVLIFGQTKITDDIKKVAKVWRLRREFNEKTSASFDVSKLGQNLNKPLECDLKRARSASENRISHLRKRNSEFSRLKPDSKNSSSKYVNKSGCCSAKPVRNFDRNAKLKRASFTKRKTVSVDSCNGSETSIEYIRLPPILTSSLGILDDCNVVMNADPNTSLESNKSYCSVRCESASSFDKSTDSSSSSDDESDDSVEPEVPNVNHDSVPAIKNNAVSNPVSVEKEKISNTEKYPLIKELHSEVKTPVISDAKIIKPQKSIPSRNEKTKEQGGDYLVQISGRYLMVTGKNSAKYIDKAWSVEKANDVTTIKFSCVLFNSLTPVFNRIKFRFPNVEHLVFCECEFNFIGQLNALADVQGLTSIEILPERNAIFTKNWRSYAIYRLHHWGLQCINNIPVTDDEVKSAKEEYKGLSEMVLWSLPESLLTPLLNKLRLEINSNVSAKQWLYKADPALRSVICKEALQWRSASSLSQSEIMSCEKGREALRSALESACNMVLKLRKLEREWKPIMYELVTNTMKDYCDVNSYMKKQISNLKPP